MGEIVRIDDALVSCHGVDKPADASCASACAIDEADGQHGAHDASRNSAPGGLKDEFDNWHARGGSYNFSRINDTEKNDENEQKPPSMV